MTYRLRLRIRRPSLEITYKGSRHWDFHLRRLLPKSLLRKRVCQISHATAYYKGPGSTLPDLIYSHWRAGGEQAGGGHCFFVRHAIPACFVVWLGDLQEMRPHPTVLGQPYTVVHPSSAGEGDKSLMQCPSWLPGWFYSILHVMFSRKEGLQVEKTKAFPDPIIKNGPHV